MFLHLSIPGTKRRPYFSFFFFFLVILFLIVPITSMAAEKDYPNRPINMVVPFSPGGGADLSSKVVGDRISKYLGQPLISVYKPGGGGTLGSAFVAGAKPDGYTILVGANAVLVFSPIVKKLDYKLDDFMPTWMYGKNPIWIAVKADSRWKSLKEFVEEAKKSPGNLKIGSYGNITVAHFMIELLQKHANIKLTHVPYKSSGAALTAVLGGHVDAAMVSGAGGLLESGTIRILAVADEQRLEGLPNVPTFKEFGYPIVTSVVMALWFPKGTPKQFVDKFCKAEEKAFKRNTKEIKEGLRRVEIWADFLNPEQTLKRYKSDYNSFYKIAEQLGAVAK